MTSLEFSISPGPSVAILNLRVQEEVWIPIEFYSVVHAQTPQNPLFNALGCFDCERLEFEGQVRLSRAVSPDIALVHRLTSHPSILERFLDETGFSVFCPLLNPYGTNPKLRETEPPCRKIETVTVDFMLEV